MTLHPQNFQSRATYLWRKAKISDGGSLNVWLVPQRFNRLRYINDPWSILRELAGSPLDLSTSRPSNVLFKEKKLLGRHLTA